MRRQLLQFLRSSPRLYDTVHRVWRRTFAPRDEIADFLAAWARTQERVTFLQIGANDGMANDPLREFVVALGWRGVAVEPLPHLHSRLVRNYVRYPAVIPEACAIGYGMGERASLFRLRAAAQRRLPVWADQIASFDRGHLTKHFPDLGDDDIEVVEVPVETIEALIARHGLDDLSLLHLDVEGYEATLLQHLDLQKVAPALIIYERTHLPGEAAAAVEKRLVESGYTVRPIGCDAVAVKASR